MHVCICMLAHVYYACVYVCVYACVCSVHAVYVHVCMYVCTCIGMLAAYCIVCVCMLCAWFENDKKNFVQHVLRPEHSASFPLSCIMEVMMHLEFLHTTCSGGLPYICI